MSALRRPLAVLHRQLQSFALPKPVQLFRKQSFSYGKLGGSLHVWKAEGSAGTVESAPKSQPAGKFPWRHDPAPLPRLKLGPEFAEYYYAPHRNAFGRSVAMRSTRSDKHFKKIISDALSGIFMMDKPWLEAIFCQRLWKSELAENVGFAFVQGVAKLLSNTHQVPFSEIMQSDDDVVSFIHPGEYSNAKSDDIVREDELKMAVSPELIAQFQKHYERNKSSAPIHLQFQLHSCEFLSINTFPLVSREVFNQHDEDRDPVFVEVVGKSSVEIGQITYEKIMSGGRIDWFAIAEVMVWCHEVFQVGALAMDTEEEIQILPLIPHVVTMERTGAAFLNPNGDFQFDLNNWQIADIDDIVDSATAAAHK